MRIAPLALCAFFALQLALTACSGGGDRSGAVPATAVLRQTQQIVPPSCNNNVIAPAKFDGLTTYLKSLVAPSGTEKGFGFIVVRKQAPPPGSKGPAGEVQVIYENAFGTFNTCTNDPIASASKMPSVLAILTLVRKHLLDLDAPISRYVPALFPSGTSITMRMLLSHRSGINNCGVNVCRSGESLGDITGAPCRQDYYMTMQMCAQEIAGLTPSFAPGTQFDYGGDDYQVAGYIAEVLSGKTWTQFFQDAVGTPCGLTSTTYGDPSYPTESNPWIAGSIYSTIEDYAKILSVSLSGGKCNDTQLVDQGLIEQMQADYDQGLPVFYSAYPAHDYGLSWWHVDPATGGDKPTVVQDWGLWGATPWLDNACHTGAFLFLYDTGLGANKSLTIMNNVINNALISGPLGCPKQSASGTAASGL